jgi:hypothetical protein
VKKSRFGDKVILSVVLLTVLVMLGAFWRMAKIGVEGLGETHRIATREALVDFYRFHRRFPTDGDELAESMKRTHAFLKAPIEAKTIQIAVEASSAKVCTISVSGRSMLGRWKDLATVSAEEAQREIANP